MPDRTPLILTSPSKLIPVLLAGILIDMRALA
jgi:hypothetical protein